MENLQEWKETLHKAEDEERRVLEHLQNLAAYLERLRNHVRNIEQVEAEGQEILASSEFALLNRYFKSPVHGFQQDSNKQWDNSAPAIAERVILELGPLHAKVLHEELRKRGYKSSASDPINHLASKLRRRPTRFKNLGGNVWDVVNRPPIGPHHKNGVPQPASESSLSHEQAPIESLNLN
jgi:hypothetical protein